MKVRARVHVRSADGTQTAVLRPGDTVPDWATVSLRVALEDTEHEPEPDPVTEPEPLVSAPVPEPVAPAAEPEPAPAAPVTKRPRRTKATPATS